MELDVVKEISQEIRQNLQVKCDINCGTDRFQQEYIVGNLALYNYPCQKIELTIDSGLEKGGI